MEKSIRYEIINKEDFFKINEFEISNVLKIYKDSLESLYNYVVEMNLVYSNKDDQIYRMCEKCMMNLWRDFLKVKKGEEKFIVIAREYVFNIPCKIIGVARFTKNENTSYKWLLEGIEVIKRFRNRGIGAEIIKHGHEYIIRFKDRELFSNIKDDNEQSIKFHENIGFKKISSKAMDSLGTEYNDASTYVIER